MQIWIFNHYAKTPSFTGGTRHYDMAQELIKKGHSVTIFASSITHNNKKEHINYNKGDKFKVENIDGINFIWIKTCKYNNKITRLVNMFSYYINAKKAVKHFKNKAPDIVIGSTVHLLAAILGLKVAKKYDARFYFEERDFWPQTLVDFKKISPNNPLSKLLYRVEKYLYDKSDKIIVLFDRADQYIVNKGVNKNKIIYLPNGISKKDIKKDIQIDTIMKEHENKNIIIYTGSHGEANDLNKIIELAKRFKQNKDIIFLFFGDGDKKRSLIKLKERYNLENVAFYDLIKKEKIPYLLSKSTLSIISIKDSPLYNFGFSMNKLYDYLYAGLPLIMLTNPSIAGSFNRDGIFVSDNLQEQESNIQQLLDHEEYYYYHSKSSKIFSEDFLWENQINKLSNTF